MSGTCGLRGTGSSMPDGRPSYLVSRLQARMGSRGSILFKLTWKVRYTKLNTPIYALRASALRTSGKDSSGWPSPLVNDAKGSDYTYNQGNHDSISLKLGGAAKLVPWATPAARDYHSESATDVFNDKRWSHSRGKPLSAQATLSTWISPQAADANGSGINQHTYSLCQQTRALTSWPTPTSSLADKGVRSMEGGIIEALRSRGPDLAAVSCLASWPTPTVGNATGGQSPAQGTSPTGQTPDGRKVTVALPQIAHLASWGTPAAREPGGTPEQQQIRYDRARAKGIVIGNTQPTGLSLQAQLSTWPTPTLVDYKGSNPLSRPQGDDLPTRVERVVGWPTPMAGTPAQNGYNEAGNTDSSRKTVALVSGPTASGSPVETAKPGQLNPAFSRWLQGYPAVWDECAIRAFRSMPTTRRKRAP